ncbi:MAG: DUF5106 domain-containing protein [Flavobacteriales bacterium]|nr:DUF5106 domain-containing protein [Flavobacteriales bacterium]
MKFLKSFIVLLLAISGTASAQYSISFKVKGLKEGDSCILAYYYADQNKVVDTAAVKNGKVTYKGDKKLDNGVYIIVLPKRSYIEFLVPKDDQEFEIQFDTSLAIAGKSAVGSLDNQLFFDFDKFASEQSKPKATLIEEYKKCADDGCKDAIRAKVEAIDEVIDKRRLELINQNPQTFVAKLFKAVMDVEIPESIKSNEDLAFEYMQKHYWDNIDLTDDGMLRTPLFKRKLENYITKMFDQNPDSLIPVIDDLCSRMEKGGAKEMYKYTVWWITNHHEESKIMCMDKVLHHMAQDYYCAGKCFWADSSLVAKMCEHAVKIGKTRCGDIAPNMQLYDTTYFRMVEMHKIQSKITVVVFWDHQCGHCKKEIPKLKEMYDTMKKRGVEVYAVYTQADVDGWKKYIKDNGLSWINVVDAHNNATYRADYNIISTPQVYILNEHKVIEFKNPPAENVGKILEYMLKEYDENNSPVKNEP